MSEKAIDFDFDNFDEDAAVKSSAAELGVKTAFGNGVFAGKFPDGRIVTVPLQVPKKLVQGLGAEFEELPADDQLVELLRAMGLDSKAEELVEQGLVGAAVFASRFFTALQKVTKVALGE